MMLRTKFKQRLARFHQDEDGLEAIQVVMIVAIAAVILLAVMLLGKEVFAWLKEAWESLRGTSIE